MTTGIQIGNEIPIAQNANYLTLFGFRLMDNGAGHCDMQIVRYNTDGSFDGVVMTIYGATGGVTTGTESLAPAADAVPTIIGGVTRVTLNSTAAAKAILTDIAGSDAVLDGQQVFIVATTLSGGSYTLVVDEGTLTFDAVDEAALVERTGSVWRVVSLRGATIV